MLLKLALVIYLRDLPDIVMKKPILLAIVAYQRFVSPYKGFHCAFHAHTGRDTCSGYGYRVFARYGTVRGWRLLRRRFGACSAAARVHYAQLAARKANRFNPQAGFVDCGGCDAPGCDLPDVGNACDCLSGLGDIGDCCSSADKAKNKSCRDWDCADWLTFMVVVALIAGALYLVWRFH